VTLESAFLYIAISVYGIAALLAYVLERHFGKERDVVVSSLFILASLFLMAYAISILWKKNLVYAFILVLSVLYTMIFLGTFMMHLKEKISLGILAVLSVFLLLTEDLLIKALILELIALINWWILRKAEKSLSSKLMISINLLGVIPLLTSALLSDYGSSLERFSVGLKVSGEVLMMIFIPYLLIYANPCESHTLPLTITAGVVIPSISALDLLHTLEALNDIVLGTLIIIIGTLSLGFSLFLRILENNSSSALAGLSQEGFSYTAMLIGIMGSTSYAFVFRGIAFYVMILYVIMTVLMLLVMLINEENLLDESLKWSPYLRMTLLFTIGFVLATAVGAPLTGGFSWRTMLYNLSSLSGHSVTVFVIVLAMTVLSLPGYIKSFIVVHESLRRKIRPYWDIFRVASVIILTLTLAVVGLLPSITLNTIIGEDYVQAYFSSVERENVAFLVVIVISFLVIYGIVPASREKRDIWSLGERVPEELYRIPPEDYYKPITEKFSKILIIKKVMERAFQRAVPYAIALIAIEVSITIIIYLSLGW